MRTDRRGFIGALLAAPLLARFWPVAAPDLTNEYDEAYARAFRAYNEAYSKWNDQVFTTVAGTPTLFTFDPGMNNWKAIPAQAIEPEMVEA